MNTLKLTHDPKDARRLAYDDRRQDHGDRGTQGWKDYYDRGMKAGLLHARDRVEMDEALEHLSPRQLEAVATTMLRGAGFEDPEDLEAYRDDSGLVSFRVKESSRYRNGSGEAGFVDADDDNVNESYLGDFQAELNGALRDGRKVRTDADRFYESVSDQDYADFVDGFSITGRP